MNETCDRCGPAVRAAYRASRDGQLYLCGHCTNQVWPALSAQGWAMQHATRSASMRQVHQITELATQAAALIPEPPADALSYVAWRELVWDTGRRLAELSRECPVHPALTPTDPSDEIDESSAHLLRLAELFRQVPADEVPTRD